MHGAQALHYALLLCAAALSTSVAATRCETTGLDAPPMATLVASPLTATDAWIVYPNCSITTLTARPTIWGYLLPPGTPYVSSHYDLNPPLTLSSRYDVIDRIESVPPGLESLDFEGTKVQWANLTDVASLQIVHLVGANLDTVDNVYLPESVGLLDLTGNRLSSLKGFRFPKSLSTLVLSTNAFTSIDSAIPDTVTQLAMASNPMTLLETIDFPEGMEVIDFSWTPIETVRGCRFPKSLNYLLFNSTSPLAEIEIRQSDVEAVRKSIHALTDSISNCSDSTATVTPIDDRIQLCVISDARFEEKYNSPKPSKESSESSSSSSGAADHSITRESVADPVATSAPLDSSVLVDSSTPQSSGAYKKTSRVETAANTSAPSPKPKTQSKPLASSSTTSKTPVAVKEDPSGDPEDNATSPSPVTLKSSSVKSAVVIVANVAGLLVLAVVVFVWRTRTARRQKPTNCENSQDGFVAVPATPMSSGLADSNRVDPDDLVVFTTNDVRNDKTLLPLRLDAGEVELGKSVSSESAGVVYLGSYRGRKVIVKQLPEAKWQDDTSVVAFMDEIRISASLDHRRIVAFVGISWVNGTDLSVVNEYLDGGDLQSLLLLQTMTSTTDWTHSWAQFRLKSKTRIALNLSDALVYLHSFGEPILHGNLNPRRVLLDKHGEAKLWWGGPHRSISINSMTITAGVAPEVLRGEQYSVEADIFALGWLIQEQDRCLRGSVEKSSFDSTNCPESVRDLVAQCLDPQSEKRPTAMEVCYRLRQADRMTK